MVVIETVYEGDLHTTVLHEPSQASFSTDAPKDNQGRGASFSPTDLVATALGSCMLTTMGLVARRHGWAMDGSRARVEKHMVADPERRIGRLACELRLPARLAGEARAALERAALGCPVHASLHPRTQVEVEFRYDL